MVPDILRRGSLFSPSREDWIDRFFYGWPTIYEQGEIWSPRTDIQETDKEIFIEMELAGIKKEDIKVEVKDNVLTISGERKKEHKDEKSAEYCCTELTYGKFERSFALPEIVRADSIKAGYKDGILTVSLAKSEKAVPKEIAVEVK